MDTDVQITIAQQTSAAYQQQIHQQQPIVHQQHLGQTAESRAPEEETAVQSLEKGGQGIKIDEKRRTRRFIKKRRERKEHSEEERVEAKDETKGRIIDVIG